MSSASTFSGHVNGNYLFMVDAKTTAISTYQLPTYQSRPRRGRFDAQDRLWFGEFDGNNIGMFNARTKESQEWPMPDAFMFPYDAVPDRPARFGRAG